MYCGPKFVNLAQPGNIYLALI